MGKHFIHDLFVYGVLSFMIGVGFYFSQLITPAPFVVGSFGAVLAAAWLLLTRNFYYVSRVFLLATLAVVGFVYANLHYDYKAGQYFSPQFGDTRETYEFVGSVDWADPRANGGRINFGIKDKASGKSYQLQVYTSREELQRLQVGCSVHFTASVSGVSHPLTPNGYDARRNAFYENRAGQGFLREIISTECPPLLRAGDYLSRLRLAITERFTQNLDAPLGSVAAALVTGVRGRIPHEVRDLFRDSGLAHLLAISGLHMVLFAGTFFALLRLLVAFFPRVVQAYDIRKYAAYAAIAAAFAYLAISGMSYATQRAFIMIVLVFVAIILGRPALTFRNIAWAALLVLLLHPPAILEPGFQMSFIAVLALISFFDGVWRHYVKPEGGKRMRTNEFTNMISQFWIYILGLLLTSLVAGGATGLVALYHFQQVGTYGLVANLAAMPIFGLLTMTMGFPAVVLMPFGLETYPMLLMGLSIEWIIGIARFVTAFDGSVWRVGASDSWVLLLIACGIIILCLWRLRFIWVSLPLLILGINFIGTAEQPLVYIYDTAKSVAVREKGGEWQLASHNRRPFVVSVWWRHFGQDFDKINKPLCAGKNWKDCVLEIDGARMVLRPKTAHIKEYCDIADIIIAPYKIIDRDCNALIIDKLALRKNRTLVIWQRENKLVPEIITSEF